jgi:hypothetical protein
MAATSDPFTRFLAAFPQRDEPHDVDAAREAWGRALGRASPEAIIAGAEAYALAMEGRPRRYVMSARRWLDESRWRDVSLRIEEKSPLVWIPYGTAQWDAWSAFYRATRGKTPPIDRRGGWRFPGPEPPLQPDAVE